MMIKLPVNPLNDGMMTPYVDPEVAEYETSVDIYNDLVQCENN